MIFVAPDVVVLDPWSSIAAEYRTVEPLRRDFSLPAPYQRAARDVHATEQGSDSETGSGSDAAAQAAASTPGSVAGKRRKRSRSKYQPNEREVEAATRHAEYAPAVAAAAASVQAWLQGSGCATVQAAVAGEAGSRQEGYAAHHRQQQQQHAAQEQQQGDDPQDCKRNGGNVATSASMHGPEGGAEPDYLALFEMRHTLKPKLQLTEAGLGSVDCWCASGAAGTGGGAQQAQQEEDAHAQRSQQIGQQQQQQQNGQQQQQQQQQGGQQQQKQQQQHHHQHHQQQQQQQSEGTHQHRDQQQQPAHNLFNRLIASGGGPGEQLAYAAGHAVVLPPGSRFLMSDARRLQPLLDDAATGGGYHCIVMDPPWENRSAKRSARYPTLPSRHLLGLPLHQLMHKDGCLVAVWVTNRERHRRFIDTELLPCWRLRHIATWHWLKVTDGGEPVGRLDIQHRRPYESLLLCWPAHLPSPGPLVATHHTAAAGAVAPAAGAGTASPSPAAPAAAAQAPAPTAEAAAAAQAPAPTAAGGDMAPGPAPAFHFLHGRTLVLAAVPPAEHSRKPHLGALLLPLLPAGARCLEMFARELHSGWTSWGNEALKLQSATHFAPRAGS